MLLVAILELVELASPPIVHISDDKNEGDLRNIEECMRRIDSLVKGDFITGQEEPTVKEEVRVAIVNEKAKEENTKKEVAKKESAENIVNASEFVGVTTDNLE
ncbi:hypothetical protein PVK06_001572 [Gossypium arboreum]|uniref:Uncharacterized protein n=1 Tax=Gossypium arboreum TaxID=29729 RepID=A0ABR0R2N9_GOSAR|nr:hypothetical protein PVK06_001572 [Gossypium arboreum]